MQKNQLILASVFGLACASTACSSDEPATQQTYPQPAATQGAETTPPEPPAAQPETAPMTSADGPIAAPAPSPMSEGVQPAAPESLRDSQILKITDLANSAEVEQAKIAKTKASNKYVKQFAQMMIAQHTQAQKKGMDVARAVAVTPEESAQAGELEKQGADTLATLKMVDATAFDVEYMNAQVKQHQALLDMLNTQLIPSATSPKVKAEMEATRTVVQRHLGSAQQIQTQLAGK